MMWSEQLLYAWQLFYEHSRGFRLFVIYFYPSVICRFFGLELDLTDLDWNLAEQDFTIGKGLENFEWDTENLKNCCTAMKNV